MHWQYTPYVWPLLLSAATTAALAAYAGRHRGVPGAGPFVVAMLLISGWSLANALEMAGADLPTKLFWANLQYAAYSVLPVALLVEGLEYTERGEWVSRRRLALLCAVPLLTVALVWTNDLHGLLRRDVHLDSGGPFPVIAKSYGPWFWIHVAYSYTLILLTLLMFLQVAVRAAPRHRGQAHALLLGLLLPLLFNVLFSLGISPIEGVDVTPVSFSAMGLALAWGLFRYRLFDLVPIANDQVVQALSDGVIVLDYRGQVAGLNPAAEKILGCAAREATGRQVSQLCGDWSELIELCCKSEPVQAELATGSGEEERHFSVHVSPLAPRRGLSGRVIALRDITARKRTERALRESDQKLREMADSLPLAIYETDRTGRMTFANQAGLAQFGFTREDFDAGLDVISLIAPEDRERAIRRFGETMAGMPGALGEYAAVRKDGSTFPVAINAGWILHDGKPAGLRGFVVDETERQQVQSQLMEQQRSVAILEERERLARELHDSIGQVLGFVNTQAQAVRELFARDQRESADAHLARLVAVVQEAHTDIREFILGIKGSAPTALGLFSTLRQYLRRFSERHGVETEFVVPEELRESAFPPAVQVQLLRILQEALANVRKHSAAHRVRVVVSCEAGRARFSMRDDGRGFDPEQVPAPGVHGFGLRVMRERVEEVGGSLEVNSAPGGGTELIVMVPLSRREVRAP